MHDFFLVCFESRKGPLEKIPFPTLSQTQSPYQQLGHHILLLGKKIDAAEVQKACMII